MNLDDFVPFGFAAVAACVLVALASAAFCAATPRANGRLKGAGGALLGLALSGAAAGLLAGAGLSWVVALAVALGLLMLGIPSASTLAALRRPHGARRG